MPNDEILEAFLKLERLKWIIFLGILDTFISPGEVSSRQYFYVLRSFLILTTYTKTDT